MPRIASAPQQQLAAIDSIRESRELAALRTPPANPEAELALVGGLLLDNKAFDKVSDFLRPVHFSDGLLGKIYGIIESLISRGQMANAVTVATFLEHDPQLVERGGKSFLADLVHSVATTIGMHDYGQVIYDCFLRRELIHVGNNVVSQAFVAAPDETAQQQIEKAEQQLFNLGETGQSQKDFKPLSFAVVRALEMAETAFKRDSHVTGVTTGFLSLDKKLGGFHPSDLIILAGRPSMGKTALATKMAYEAAKAYVPNTKNHDAQEGARIAFFSMEMSGEQLALRLISEQTKISSDRIRRGEVKAEDFEKFVTASHHLSSIPFYIDDTPGLTIAGIRARARRLKRQQGLDLIVIDYLQLIQPTERSSSENRVQVVSEITRGLKIMAKELHVPVIALSQLSRGPEQREDKRPQLADLRESGSIEQDADVVMFIFREEYYLAREQPHEGTDKHLEWQQAMEKVHNIAEVVVAKQRHGPIGTIKLFFDGQYTTFADLYPD